jgi:hypothetical protein
MVTNLWKIGSDMAVFAVTLKRNNELFLISNVRPVLNVVFFLLGDSRHLKLKASIMEHPVCPTFIGASEGGAEF